jgi:hypothetical protein
MANSDVHNVPKGDGYVKYLEKGMIMKPPKPVKGVRRWLRLKRAGFVRAVARLARIRIDVHQSVFDANYAFTR